MQAGIKKFLKFSIILSIIYNIGATCFYGIVIHGLALGNLSLWELIYNVLVIGIPLMIISFFEYMVIRNVDKETLTIKDELFLWIVGALRLYFIIFTGPVGVLNIISAYMVRKERKL